jgi:hypothetical protein
MLVLILGIVCCMIQPGLASEDTAPEEQQPCDTESDETCASEEDEEELERGFDPCLINSALPACNSDANSRDSGAGQEPPSKAEESDDSG